MSDFIRNTGWLEGPSFLWKPEEDLPADGMGSPNATDHLIAYFSDWRKLKTSVAWFLRLKKKTVVGT